MKTKHLLTCVLILALSPLLASAAVFIKIDGIDGESGDKDHEGWIDVDSVLVRSADHKDWIDLQSFSQIVHRDIAARNVREKRDTASGQATGHRDAASGLPTGKRQTNPSRSPSTSTKLLPCSPRRSVVGIRLVT